MAPKAKSAMAPKKKGSLTKGTTKAWSLTKGTKKPGSLTKGSSAKGSLTKGTSAMKKPSFQQQSNESDEIFFEEKHVGKAGKNDTCPKNKQSC